ncbi:serine/threonine-protein kinase [Nonomuraea sp. NPDC048916]|uniref:serine/threonine-protein kinase n=1 Tax=Nonomuraea sp. NPDC048916 TaxID=3154232 RepID=UPI0033C38A7B
MPQISPLVAGDPGELGSFRLSGRIGEGGQGIVYLGVNEQGEQAAIKLLHIKFSGDTIARSRFARELKAAQRVASFCTARVIEADLDGDTPYIASEYIDGRALRDIVDDDGPLRGTALDRLAIGTATALTAIHHASIVHRDFKPDNVLIAADGPRVVDFGIARIIDSTGTITSRAIGTPAYMAPEQIAGDDIGPYTDVFAWGATIAFAASGQVAFEGNSIAVVLNRILNHEVDVSMMPEPLRGVVRSALAKAPDERPSADQILLRLLGQPESAGASTAVLTRGVQVASDDTTPFKRVSASRIEHRPAGTYSQGTGTPQQESAMFSQDSGTFQQGSGMSHHGSGTSGQGVETSERGPRTAGAGVSEDAGGPVTWAARTEAAVTPGTEAGSLAPGERRPRRRVWWAALATTLLLIAGAVVVAVANGWPQRAFGGGPPPGVTDGSKSVVAGPFTSVVDKVATTGKLVIGVKGDLPGIGLERNGGFEGFDVDLARRIATALGAKETEFVRVSRGDRAETLADGRVDLVLATYSIDKSDVEFAGPYYLAHQDLLVRDGAGVDSLADLKGRKICAPDSPSVGRVQARVRVEPVPAGDYAQCMDLLRSGQVDAVPGDDLILAGFAGRENLRYKILGAKLTDERYAVGIKRGDAKTCKAVKAVIADLYRSGAMKQLLTRQFAKVDFAPELKVPAMEPCG